MSSRHWRTGAGALCLAMCASVTAGPRAVPSPESPAVRELVAAAIATNDPHGGPFAVVDKVNARVFVYDAGGALKGSSPVLLGLARGDDSVPGIGERKMADIRPNERTTPAGRFVSEPGRNLGGEDIVWVDYDAAISMHRVRATQKTERRLERLASPSAADNRISYGCINVPAVFYDTHIRPTLGQAQALVYVLPETNAARERFAFLNPAARTVK